MTRGRPMRPGQGSRGRSVVGRSMGLHLQGPVLQSATRRLSYCRVGKTHERSVCLSVCPVQLSVYIYIYIRYTVWLHCSTTPWCSRRQIEAKIQCSVSFSVWWVCRQTLDVLGESVNNKDARRIGRNRLT